MTVEVAILNRQAVSLAADSAVTISGPSGPKIFNTVNKLFALSKYQPVGMMVYSSADVMGVPVETLIKVFRQQLGDEELPRLEDYHDRFYTFLTTNQKLFPDDARLAQCMNVVSTSLVKIWNSIMGEIKNDYPGFNQPKMSEVKQIAKRWLDVNHALSRSALELPNAKQKKAKLRRLLKVPIEHIKADFKDTFGLSDADLRIVPELCIDALTRDRPVRNTETGFVVAGFGGDEFFPQLRNFEFELSFDGLNKTFNKEKSDLSITNASIVPFAQKEMIETFVQGRERSVDRFLVKMISDYFDQQKVDTAKNPPPNSDVAELLKVIDELKDDLCKSFKSSLDSYTREQYIDPILETVAAMPKEELAVMAEALVNLTSIKRRMSPDAETVGPPTDVAIISKGDGFVWIKRKHYFDEKLNGAFKHNYFRQG